MRPLHPRDIIRDVPYGGNSIDRALVEKRRKNVTKHNGNTIVIALLGKSEAREADAGVVDDTIGRRPCMSSSSALLVQKVEPHQYSTREGSRRIFYLS